MTRRDLLAGLILLPLLASPALAADEPRGLDLYFLDVDGGAATLIVTPERESILIDTGWPGHEDRDPKRIVHALKDLAGCDHLDHLIITHWHMDHFGGVEGLAKLVRIDHFWDRGLPDLTRPDADKSAYPDGPAADDPLGIAYRKASEGKRKALNVGDPLPLKGNLKALVVASGGKVFAPPSVGEPNPACVDLPPDQPEDTSDNARSLALLFHLGPFTFLDCGDLTWNVEQKLVCPVNVIGQVDLFQVTHHGMDISNHPTLLKSIAPTVAIMDNGPRKGGSAETVKRLREVSSLKAAYQLHKNAATGPDQNTDPSKIANAPGSNGQFIHVHVEPSGKRYSVHIGADGPSESFESK